ncbi:MAG: hypothetical protein IKO49_02120 [Bacilli bacterium]|nr:hypothetical protein [Clostridia bacterium]MBR4618077.1 hypothetical protein [Bacilli bacterium]
MKLVTGKFCIPCKMLKQWLSENHIQVDEVLADDIIEDVERLGIKQTPTLILDDETLIAGKDDIVEYFEEKEGLNDE